MIIHNNSVASVMVGDCLESLRTLPAGLVNTCVTSPPYYGLRDYGHDGQIGLEETPDAYIARLVEVFREVRRVLRDNGTLWVNIGDSYAGGGGFAPNAPSNRPEAQSARGTAQNRGSVKGGIKPQGDVKSKDLIGIPWMLAFALRADGWYLRQDIIWHKPNPMPESVRDRCTKAHEYVFLLSKNERYYCDMDAVKEPADPKNFRDSPCARRCPPPGQTTDTGFLNGRRYETRNKRSVWTVAPKPYSGAHFAVYPPELIEPCILAGCPVGGLVLDTFGGSGTTAGVALANGRDAILCELNPEYAALMPDRVRYITDRTPVLKVAA